MRAIILLFAFAIVVSGCASAPTGPRVAVMPAQGKPFEVFVADDKLCRTYAEQSIGESRNESAAKNFAGAAAVGTVVGAAAGALSNEGHGSGGAGAGLVVGSMVGAGESANASRDSQRRYDIAYEQCMYAKGNQIPGYATQRQTYNPPPPPQR
jgi:hypothetical protein